MERNTQVSARTGSDFVSIPKVSLPNSDEDYHYKHFFFHREQRIKKLEERNANYRPKGPHKDGRHLLEYVLAKLRSVDLSEDPIQWGPQSCPYVMNKWSKLFFVLFLDKYSTSSSSNY